MDITELIKENEKLKTEIIELNDLELEFHIKRVNHALYIMPQECHLVDIILHLIEI